MELKLAQEEDLNITQGDSGEVHHVIQELKEATGGGKAKSSDGMLRVVAGRKIPNTFEKFGMNLYRFSNGPTFHFTRADYTYDPEKGQYVWDAPVFTYFLDNLTVGTVFQGLSGAKLESGVDWFYSGSLVYINEDIVQAEEEQSDVNSGSIFNCQFQGSVKNAFVQKDSGEIQAVHVERALTTSPNLEIISGQITNVTIPRAVAKLTNTSIRGVEVGQPCVVKYRRTGLRKRSGIYIRKKDYQYSCIHKGPKSLYVHRRAIVPSGSYTNVNLDAEIWGQGYVRQCCLNSEGRTPYFKRARLYPISRKRWVGTQYVEISTAWIPKVIQESSSET